MPVAHFAREYDSHKHSLPPNSETHFKLVLVSDAFDGMMPVRRHQMLYKILAEELDGPVHALALHTHTPAEWQAKGGEILASPDCLGGRNRDPQMAAGKHKAGEKQ